MSLKNYLFILIGTLILLLTISQLLLINWLQESFDSKVDMKARSISERVLELAVDEVFDRKDNTPTVQIRQTLQDKDADNQSVTIIEFSEREIEDTSHAIEQGLQATHKIIKRLKANPEIEKVVKDIPPTLIDEEALEQVSVALNSKQLKKEFKVIVDSLHQNQAQVIATSGHAIALPATFKGDVQRSTWSFNSNDGFDTQPLVRSIQISLIIGAIIALIIGYLISNRFNRPLKALANGFEQVSKGNFNATVEEQGISEIKNTIVYFNAMVNRLNELTVAEAQMKESTHLAELGDVSRGLAHALRNPIHTIGLSIEQLIENDLTTKQKENLLNTMQQKIVGIDNSIKALLMLTTTGISRDESIPIIAVVQDIILEYKTTFTQDVKFDLDIANNICVRGSETEVRNILHTLIINACEANNNTGIISISAKQKGEEITINVLDQGDGLDETVKNQLFKPHVSTKPEGAGMGLYIAQRIAKLHYNGAIELTNCHPEEQGAIATVVFYKENI